MNEACPRWEHVVVVLPPRLPEETAVPSSGGMAPPGEDHHQGGAPAARRSLRRRRPLSSDLHRQTPALPGTAQFEDLLALGHSVPAGVRAGRADGQLITIVVVAVDVLRAAGTQVRVENRDDADMIREELHNDHGGKL